MYVEMMSVCIMTIDYKILEILFKKANIIDVLFVHIHLKVYVNTFKV